MTKLNTNCKNDDHFKHLVQMKIICNTHYKNENEEGI